MTGHHAPDSRRPAVEVVRTAAHPRAVIITAHGGRADGTAVPHRGKLTYLRMLPFSLMWDHLPEIAVWRLRYRHTGWNGPETSPLADLDWALSTVHDQHPRTPAILIGHSMGGRAVLRASASAEVAAVCALAPWIKPTDPLTQLRGRAVRVIHGDRDRITDPRASRDYVEQARELGVDAEFHGVTGAGHAMLRHRRRWRELTRDFVTATVHNLPTTEAPH